MRPFASRRTKRRTATFSPIFWTSATRLCSTVSPLCIFAAPIAATFLRLLGGDARHFLRERLEVVVLGDEVGLAVDLHDRGKLRARRDVQADHALRGDAIRRLACLRAALDPQQLLGLGHVALRLGQRLLAFHHAEPRAGPQLHHSARGNVRHLKLRSIRD